tara:strand:+ start:17273 stop:18289 length:1017 start_codon:yes stop_codon:yes gene_type:complete
MKIDHVSHSSLSALKVSPLYFQKYIGRELEDDKKSYNLGSAIHCYILEQEKFHSRYSVSNVPVVGGMMGKFIEALIKNEKFLVESVYDSTEDTPAELVIKSIDELYEQCYTISGFKIPMATVINKLETAENKQYLDFLRQSEDKTILSQEDMGIVLNCSEAVKAHSIASHILNTSDLSGAEPEKELLWKHKDFKIKSIIDNLILNKDRKLVTIVDLKTTAKSVYGFSRAYSSYGYYRQIAIYKLAVLDYLKSLGEDPMEYDIKSYIVAVQTTGLFECVVYEPDSLDLSVAVDEFESLLARLQWHQDHNHWDYPMEYYKNNGVIKIKLSDESISRIKEN